MSAPSPSPSTTTTTTMVGNIAAVVTDSGTLAVDRHTFRVVSSATDLTGKLDLALVSDEGQGVGDAHCTQTFQVSPELPAQIRPTLMICWRTSAQRSVFTVSVDLDHRPSSAAAVAVIDQTWASMGG